MGLRSVLRRRRHSVYSELEEHVKQVKELTENFRTLIESLKNENYDELYKLYSAIDEGERRADALRRKIAEDVCKGTFFAHLREDVLNLIEKVDDVADWVKGVARVIVDTPPRRELLAFVLSLAEMERYVDSLVDAVSKLSEIISLLKREGIKITPMLQQIEDIEEVADELKINLIKKLLSEADNFRIIDVLEVRDMIYMLDNAIDSAEDASDIILVILAKSYG